MPVPDHDRDLLERMIATATPGLEASGIAIFEDGPARAFTWSTALGPGRARMNRLPWFVRFVSSAEGGTSKLDFLDLTTDDMEEGERIAAVYRQRTWWHGRGSGHGAAYVEVPDFDPARCYPTERWRAYVDEDLAQRDWPPFGGDPPAGRGEVFACRR